MRTKLSLVLMTVMAIMLFGCTASEKEAASTSAASGSHFKAATVEFSGTGYTVAGLTFQAPSGWNDIGPSGMRKAQYAFGPVEGDSDSAALAVYYFGEGQGGATRANIDRWIGQIVQPDGSDSFEKSVESVVELSGMKSHVVEVTGTYASGGMGMAPVKEMTNYRMTGVVVEGPQGSVFFKLTGPDKTAAMMTGGLAAMLENIKTTE